MKNLLLFGVLFLLTCGGHSMSQETSPFSWNQLEKFHVPLAYPLLIAKGSKGFLSCAYLSADVCTNKTKEACAIVTGVKTHEDMLTAKVIAVSEKAQGLGIEVGMTGRKALDLFR